MSAYYCGQCGGFISGAWFGSVPPVMCKCTTTAPPQSFPAGVYLPADGAKTPTLFGWTCPRCFKVHSPFSTNCDCPPPIYTSTGSTSQVHPGSPLKNGN